MSQLFKNVYAANMMHKIGLLPFTPGLMADKSQLLPTTIPLSSGSKLFDATLCKRFAAPCPSTVMDALTKKLIHIALVDHLSRRRSDEK